MGLLKGSDVVLSDYRLPMQHLLKVYHLGYGYATVTPENVLIILTPLN
jgi:hypothetical protein